MSRDLLTVRIQEVPCAVVHIQNISARRQRSAIVPILVRGNPRDFFFPVLAQEDQRIFGIGFSRDYLQRAPIGRLNGLERNDAQMSLDATWRHSIIRRSTANRTHKETADDQVLEKQILPLRKIWAGQIFTIPPTTN